MLNIAQITNKGPVAHNNTQQATQVTSNNIDQPTNSENPVQSQFSDVLETQINAAEQLAQGNLFSATLEVIKSVNIDLNNQENKDELTLSDTVITDQNGLVIASLMQPNLTNEINNEDLSLTDNTSYIEKIELPELSLEQNISTTSDDNGSEIESSIDSNVIPQEVVLVPLNSNLTQTSNNNIQITEASEKINDVTQKANSNTNKLNNNYELASITKSQDVEDIDIDIEFDDNSIEQNKQNNTDNHIDLSENKVKSKPEVILNSKSSLEFGASVENIISDQNKDDDESQDTLAINSELEELINDLELKTDNKVNAVAKEASTPIQDIVETAVKENQEIEQSAQVENSNQENITSNKLQQTSNNKVSEQKFDLEQRFNIKTPVVEQVKTQFVKNIENGNRQMTVQLEPVELGKLEISVLMNKDNTIQHIFVNVEKPETLEILQKDISNLEKTLSVKIDSAEINLSMMNERSFSDEQREFMENQKEFLKNLNKNNEDDLTTDSVTKVYQSDKLLDIVA